MDVATVDRGRPARAVDVTYSAAVTPLGAVTVMVSAWSGRSPTSALPIAPSVHALLCDLLE